MKRMKCSWIRTKPRKAHRVHTLETTLAIIKPDGMQYRNEIIQIILKAGFQIIQRKMTRLTPEQASDFYKDKYDLKAYNLMVLSLSEGPIESIVLAKENSIEEWKCMMGPERTTDAIICYPETIRGMFGTCSDDQRNVVHGSEDERYARFEIHYFFPNFLIEPLRLEDAQKLCCETILMSTLFDGLYKVSQERPFDPISWLAQWLLHNNPLKPILSDTCEKMQEKIGELEKISNQLDLQAVENKMAERKPSNSSVFSSFVSCFCSIEPSSSMSSSNKTVSSTHAENCTCRHVLKPTDVTFCPVCHKIMKFGLTTQAERSSEASSSSHVITAASSSSVETQTDSGGASVKCGKRADPCAKLYL